MGEKLKETIDTLSTGEKQQTFLLKLTDALRPLGNPVDIEEAATNTAMDFMDADRCHYSFIEEDNVIILRDAVRGDLPSVAGVHPISSFPLYKAVLNAGRPFIVEDACTNNILDEDLKELCLQSQYGSFINVPVIKNGKPVGLLSLVQSKPRKWTDAEVQLTVETAERTWAAVERAKAEEALRKSEEPLRAVLEQAPLAIAITGALGDIQFHNTMFDELWGRPAHDTEASKYSQVYAGFHLDGTPIESEDWPGSKAIMKGEVVIDEVLEIVHQSGRKIPCSFNAGPIHNEDGKITGGVVLFRDVTAERTASMQLQESEAKYRMLFDSIDEAFSILEVLFDDKGKAVDYVFLEMNNAHEAMTGMSQTAVGTRISELMPDMEESVLERLGKVVLTGEPVRYEQYVSAWNRWFDVHSSRIGGHGSRIVANVFNNITDRKQSEAKIKESESRFHTMADASPVLIWTINADGLSSYYNKTFRDFIGVSKEEDISDWGKIVHPDDVQTTFSTINTAIAEHHSYSLECRLLRADGQWRWVLAQGNPSMGADNEFLGFVGSSVDITERKEAEAKIKESEHRFHQMIFSSPSMIAILKGEDFIIEVANDPILEELSKEKDIIGLPYLKAVPELDEQGFGELLREVYKTGIPHYAHEMPGTLLHSGNEITNYYNFIYQAQRNIDNEIVGIAIM